MTVAEMFETSTDIVCPHGLTENGAIFLLGHLSEDAANKLLAQSAWAPMWALSPQHEWATFDWHAPECDEECECSCPDLAHLDTGHVGDHDCAEYCSHCCLCSEDMYGYVRPATPTTPGAVAVTMAGWADDDGFMVWLAESYEASVFGFARSAVSL